MGPNRKPTYSGIAVTTSDVALSNVFEAFMVTGTTGTVVAVTDLGSTVTFTAVALNTVIPVRVTSIKTASTAVGILGLKSALT